MASEIIKDDMMPDRSRLFCPMERTMTKMFFSLVDYRNNYFTSDDPNKIIEFYNGFENRDQLTQWMKERPKGVGNIHEVDGDKDIIVVIPTADFNGKYAKECRENIFKSLHIVFVESGGKGDFYFNFAHNCNVGIKRAMEYNPKWVVVSNDDVLALDPIQILTEELDKIYTLEPAIALDIENSNRHIHTDLGYKRWITNYLFIILGISTKDKMKLEKRFGMYRIAMHSSLISKFLMKVNSSFPSGGAFSIFNFTFVIKKQGEVYNADFINAWEDIYLYFCINEEHTKIFQINYRISTLHSMTFGHSYLRRLRDLASSVLFEKLLKI